MKFLAFVGDFFTPMLPLLLFFYSSLHYSLLLCPVPLHCFFFFLAILYPLYPVSSALLFFYPCAVLILF
ncbi:hypothetical protein PPACK8108_LOCUS14449 [Phakopsora pachyrhizi]|uniref:Uncharacterized protein n=1 Tax=Phakopsora pachyrhizi TaxID=170000 RepID=A0AAV0B7C7_PHAPC|nr:hypothetical protein PPACK8108_LOCUS14449 [Phakopsora pachyrhizi]